ncbi:oligogalacturonate lyase family protein [Granulicella sibirica]|uniref:Oligogalacturonate lyase n=1 Tax=Granulicella sibirica TaxID=2479048 RepID=A0A4Q0SVW5_9BACT|nr:oligogalacturonate lyase family protein [Granulicella sibirica]RXH55245.1 Oligogalacturonate lyase [Granulicella sibirica]
MTSTTPRFLLAALTFSCFPALAVSQAVAPASPPPQSWVDKTTGHRVIRLTNEPNSTGFYFNNNAYTPDGRKMIYTAPDGIHVLDLATRKTRLLVPNPPRPETEDPVARYRGGVHAIVAGHQTPSIFFSKMDLTTKLSTLYKADVDTGVVTELVTLPEGANSVATINADETLAAGTMNDGSPVAPEYGANLTSPTGTPAVRQVTGAQSGTLVQPDGKGEMMERRLASRQPLILFTINLKTGKLTTLLHSTDWVNHLLFSPADPTLLMYCHEGPWQKVDRIWTIRTDGSQNTLIHKRTFAQEIAGHEFWGIDGKTIWYDWQPIKGEDFYLAGYDVATHRRRAFHMDRNEWSIHFNVTADEGLFTGDGGDPGQVAKAPDGEFIELFHPEMKKVDGINQPGFIQPGVFHAEHLVTMSKHNYRLEPNVRFSPDHKLVIFTSNMFGPSYVFGVEVDKASPGPANGN